MIAFRPGVSSTKWRRSLSASLGWDRVSIKRFTKELEDVGGTESIYAALSRESGTKMGVAPSVVIYDELGQSEGRDLLDALDTAMGKRAEPLMIIISTQAARDEAPLSQLIDLKVANVMPASTWARPRT